MGCSSSSEAKPQETQSTPQPETLASKLRSGTDPAATGPIMAKDSFQEEIPLEVVTNGTLGLNLPFFRFPTEGALGGDIFQQFLSLLEQKKDEPHKTSHRSLYGHVKVCRLMMEGLKLEFLSQERAFNLSADGSVSFRPDLVFRWRRRDRDILVICEVQLPLNDRPKAVTASNNGKREFTQCGKALKIFGEEVCCALGFVQRKHEKQLVTVHSEGKYGGELVKLIEKHGKKWSIFLAPNLTPLLHTN